VQNFQRQFVCLFTCLGNFWNWNFIFVQIRNVDDRRRRWADVLWNNLIGMLSLLMLLLMWLMFSLLLLWRRRCLIEGDALNSGQRSDVDEARKIDGHRRRDRRSRHIDVTSRRRIEEFRSVHRTKYLSRIVGRGFWSTRRRRKGWGWTSLTRLRRERFVLHAHGFRGRRKLWNEKKLILNSSPIFDYIKFNIRCLEERCFNNNFNRKNTYSLLNWPVVCLQIN